MYIGETTELSSDIFCVTVWTSQAHRGAGTKNVLKLWDGKENKKHMEDKNVVEFWISIQRYFIHTLIWQNSV